MLTDENGNITDTYDYDAFGNLTTKTGTTENAYLYCGEQFDALTGLYYLRARYMDPTNGRFTTMDSYAGALVDPMSLHKYLYANSNPVTFKDPSGNFTVGYALTIMQAVGISATIVKTAIQYQRFMNDGPGPIEMLLMVLQSVQNALITFAFCAISAAVPPLGVALAVSGVIFQTKFIMEAIENGDWVMAILGVFELVGMIAGMFNSCFTGDTLVATEDGHKRIDEIKVGDKVWAYNPETGEKELKEVLNVFVKETDEILHLKTTDGDIDTTTTHPFYVVGEGWKAAGDLKVGDKIYALDGTTVTITAANLEKLDKPIKVYNLEVADFHTYFVGNTGMLVHNDCRSTNKIKPNSEAVGPHSSFKTDPKTGETTNYRTYETNPHHPDGFSEVIGYDGTGQPHRNKVTGEDLLPHVHDKTTPGGVRPPRPDEIPGKKR